MSSFPKGQIVSTSQHSFSGLFGVNSIVTVLQAEPAPYATFVKGYFGSYSGASGIGRIIAIGPNNANLTTDYTIKTQNFSEVAAAVTWQARHGGDFNLTTGPFEYELLANGFLMLGRTSQFGILIPPEYYLYVSLTIGAFSAHSYNFTKTVIQQEA